MLPSARAWSRTHDLLRVLVDRSPFVFYRFRARPEARFEFVSDTVRDVYGYSPEEFYQNPEILARRIHDDDRTRLEEILADPAGAGAEGRILRWRRRDGRLVTTASWTFPVESEDGAVVLEGINQEITGWHDLGTPLPDATRLLNALGEAVLYCDAGGTIRFYNRAAQNVLGWSAEEAVGQDVVTLLWPEDGRGDARALLERVAAGEMLTREARIRREDGSRSWMWLSASPVRDGAGEVTGILGISKDIAFQREAGLELDRFFSLSLDLLCIADMSGRFLRVNPAFTELLGWSEEELLDRPFIDFVHPDDRERTEEAARRAAEGEITSFENRYRTRDGGYRWFHWKSTAVASEGKIYASARDITRRREAEAELRSLTQDLEDRVDDRTVGLEAANESLRRELARRERAERAHDRAESRFRDVFHYAPMGIAQVTADGTILSGNGTLARTLGYASSEELSGLNLPSETFAPESSWKELRAELDEGLTIVGREIVWRRRDGERMWVELDGIRVPGDDGEALYYQLFADDVTERKSLEEQLRHSQKMEAVGTLAGGVAHDFNNLLTVILGNAELILMGDLPPDDPMREEAESIRSAAKRANELTRQLLTFSRRDVVRPEVLDLNELVRSMERMLSRLVRDDVEIQTTLADAHLRVRADGGQLEQVVMNLVVNAQEAMPEGGRIRLRTSRVELSEEYAASHADAESGLHVLLSVTDTGIGIDEETRKRIFEPFFTTKGSRGGTGLGLSTVYGIVKQWGGHLGVYTEPGQGTVFKVYFPLHEGETQQRELPGEDSEAALGGSETLLVVEDEEWVLETARRILGSYGYRVLTARSGEEAIHRLKEVEGAVDLVLTDVVMPGMRGPQLVERIQKEYPGIGVVYTSGYADEEVRDRKLVEEADAFLEKPFTPEALAGIVGRVLDGG